MPAPAQDFARLRCRRLAASLYRPSRIRLLFVGEAPPPERFFYFGDSLFLRALRGVFVAALPELERQGIAAFLAFYQELGGWRWDVCETPRRATKGGADEVRDCLENIQPRWAGLPLTPEPIVIVSPKRLLPQLPECLKNQVTLSVAPPGQWNAHRQAFAHEVGALIQREIGGEGLRQAICRVDVDDARLDFEIARGAAAGADEAQIICLLRGHPREVELRAVWTGQSEF